MLSRESLLLYCRSRCNVCYLEWSSCVVRQSSSCFVLLTAYHLDSFKCLILCTFIIVNLSKPLEYFDECKTSTISDEMSYFNGCEKSADNGRNASSLFSEQQDVTHVAFIWTTKKVLCQSIRLL